MNSKHQPTIVFGIQCALIIMVILALTAINPLPAQAATPTPTAVPAKPFMVYLGFDDGPVPGATDRVLDILKQYNVKATFFVEGAHIATAPYLLRRELQEGHHIGNMLVFHDPSVMAFGHADTKLLVEKYNETDAAIRAALGPLAAQWDAEEPYKPFRWPGGAVKAFPLANVVTYNWNTTNADDLPNGNTLSGILYATLYGYPPAHYYGVYAWGNQAVVLLHDESRTMADVLPLILKNLLANGVTFGTLPRPFDKLGTMPIKIGDVPACARQVGNCSFMYHHYKLLVY